jgi:hypothetical protein
VSDLPFDYPDTTPPNLGAAPKRCRRHGWGPLTRITPDDAPVGTIAVYVATCVKCGIRRDNAAARRGRNNRSRGNRAELDVARSINGRKVGPLGHPWDVEMPGYARLQVKKLATPPSLRTIAAELTRIGSGAEMPGFIWIEPGRGGERLITFRLSDFAERHGVPTE